MENGVQPFSFTPNKDVSKSALESDRKIELGTATATASEKSNVTKKNTVSSFSTSRSVTVEKKSTIFKKKCWTNLNTHKSINSLDTLELCRKYGYNNEGLYVIPEFLKLLNSLNKEQCSMASHIKYPRDCSLSIKNDQAYDIVVVGCGATGSVIGSKISDLKDVSVLVLEAGDIPSIESEIPGLWANSIGTIMDWNLCAKEDKTFGQSLDKNRVKIIRGKCVGGTTCMNTMLYDRGTASDYIKFEKAGLTKWCWKDVLKYYKRSEDCKFEKITTSETVSNYHSQGGVMSVDSFRNTKTIKIREVYSTALKSVNCNTSDVLNVTNHHGFVSSLANVENGLRVNAARAYLSNIEKKYNLKIAAKSLVKKIIFEDQKAVGVEFINSVGKLIRVKCNKYVILCAGPIGSPQLLLESGVGPKNLLDSMNIPIVVNNEKVGSNLQAHPCFIGLLLKFEKGLIKSHSISEMVFEYLMKHTGPLATIGLCSFTGFIDVDGNGDSDIQLINYYYSQDDNLFMPSQLDALNYNDAITEQIIQVNENYDIQVVAISLLRPKNTGKVTIKKSDKKYEPVIEFGSLANEDVDTLLKAIAWVKKFIELPAFKNYGPSIVPFKFDDGPTPNVDCNEYWKYAIKQLTSMNIQMTGTCSMATQSSNGVVNEDLEVFGAQSLMVADSSVLPIMFSAESCAPSFMVAEKAADMLKKKLGCLDDEDDEESEEEKEKKNKEEKTC